MINIIQACEEHISLSHELETNLSRSLNFKLRFESSEKVNIRSEPGIPSDPKEKLMSLNSSRLQSSGSRSFFSRFIPWKKNAHVLNTSRFYNDDHGNYEHQNNGNFEGNKRYGCSISPPVMGSDEEGKNILSTKLPQASSSDLKSYFHNGSRIEEKKNLTSSQDGIQSCDSTCDNTGTTSPASTVVSGALPIVDLSCNSGCSVTRQSSSNYSITGTKEGDEKLINVSIAFSEVLQLQVVRHNASSYTCLEYLYTICVHGSSISILSAYHYFRSAILFFLPSSFIIFFCLFYIVIQSLEILFFTYDLSCYYFCRPPSYYFLFLFLGECIGCCSHDGESPRRSGIMSYVS